MYKVERRYDIDWIRVIAITLLLFFHSAIIFMPYAKSVGYMHSKDTITWLIIPMSMIMLWRIPLLFFVSGISVYFALKKRTWLQFIIERSKRILIPFIIGMVLIVPMQNLILQFFFNQDLRYEAGTAHLWFLGNIFCYVLLLLPLFYFLVHQKNERIQQALRKIGGHPLGLILIIFLIVLENQILNPKSFEYYARSWHGFLLGLVTFLFGFLFEYSGKYFWSAILKYRWGFLALATILLLARFKYWWLYSPQYLMATESVICVFTILAFGYKYLNNPSQILTYLSKAAYPVYILHQLFIFLAAYFILSFQISSWIKYLLITGFCFAGSLIIYEFLLRRVWWIGICFGIIKSKIGN